MMTIPFNKYLLLISLLLFNWSFSYAQNAYILILKNGNKIDLNDMSISRGDKITIQIVNNNPQIEYKISNLNLEVRTQEYQKSKTQKQAEKYQKNITLNTAIFEKTPKIEIWVKDYGSRYVSRLLLKFLSVEQMKDNKQTKVDWITYGKEYEFWYYN